MNLEVCNGRFGYAEQQIIHEDISFSVEKGELLTVLGPNGVGKTTLLRCITGLLAWTSGKTLIDGKPLSQFSNNSLWKRIGYVPQSSFSKFTYPVLDMVLLGRASHLSLYETPKKRDYEIAFHALERMGIAHIYKKSCDQISGGEYQLVLIARALAAEPELLILDEPESHLDFRNQMLVLGTLEKVVREENLSCIINTHYPEHAIRLGDISLMLGNGLPYLFGKSSDVITADNLSSYFGVQVKMISVTWENKTYCSIIPLRLNIN